MDTSVFLTSNNYYSGFNKTQETCHCGLLDSVAEWSKALASGVSLYGGVGSNPTAVILMSRSFSQVKLNRVEKELLDKATHALR